MATHVRPRTIILTLAVLLAWAGPLKGGVVTQTYDFSESGFFNDAGGGPATPPFASVTGSVTVMFDPSGAGVIDQTTGITLNSLSIPLGSAFGFDFFPNNPPGENGLEFGGTAFGVNGLSSGDDFVIGFLFNGTNPADVVPNSGVGGYTSTSAFGGIYDATVFTVTPVPEPSVIILLSSALPGIAFFRHRRRARPDAARFRD